MISIMILAVFSGLSLNLLLQFALGTAGAAADKLHNGDKVPRELPLIQLGFLFISVFFLWIFFNFFFPSKWRGFLEYFLYFPVSALLCMGLELLGDRVIPSLSEKTSWPVDRIKKVYSAFTAYDGLVLFALVITSFVARNFTDAFFLAFFFAVGNMVAMLILNEIRRKSALERIPRYLRGSPVVLISMGLLSLISAFVAGICFKILEAF